MDADVSCCVCWQSFLDVEPVVLSACGHTICKGCALKLGSESYSGATTIKCPFCQQSSCYKHKQDIKSNYTLRGLLHSLQTNETGGDSEEVVELVKSNVKAPKKMMAGTRCCYCSWYLALQNKYVCSYCSETFCYKCAEIHQQKEQERYAQAQGEVKQKVIRIKADLALHNKALEAKCEKLEQDVLELVEEKTELHRKLRQRPISNTYETTAIPGPKPHVMFVAIAFALCIYFSYLS